VGNRGLGIGIREKGLELDPGKMIYHPVGYRGKNDSLTQVGCKQPDFVQMDNFPASFRYPPGRKE
jgi:hypothetical protein